MFTLNKTVMDAIEREQIVEFVKNSMDMNPDAGVLSTIKAAADFHDVVMSEQEINDLGFSIMFGADQDDSPF